jgi:hypothetical protein
MLPLGGRVAMFSRFERTEDMENGVVKFERNSVWLKPDEFAAGLFSLLSSGSLSRQTPFAEVYPPCASAGEKRSESLLAIRRHTRGSVHVRGKVEGIQQTHPVEFGEHCHISTLSFQPFSQSDTAHRVQATEIRRSRLSGHEARLVPSGQR